jgi:hypothetical protein
MGYTVMMLVSRKAGTTIEQFKAHYENSHVPLLMDVLKEVAPVSHTRYYLKRDEAKKGGADVAPPMVFVGDASTVNFDCITKVELRDEAHFGEFNKAFMARRADIAADQEQFADGSKFRVVGIESTEVTTP